MAIAVFWFALRPLAQTSGTIAAQVSAPATVVRDAAGVPHIKAATWQDAVFLQGYVTAQDRLWQMDALRRLAAGELAEVVGALAVNSDRDARRLRMRRTAEAHFKTLPPADREVMAAYARGVNAFIETHLDNLPIEFTILGYHPRPWSAVDSILAGLQMHRNLTTTFDAELAKEKLLQGGDAAKVNQLFPSRTGREAQPGSNAWVISGAHTATGKPLLANDPHLEFGIPSTWFQIHLEAPGLNVTGVSLPGVPCIVVGHNERIAWGVTNLGYDVQDTYLEKFNLNSGRYVFQGQTEQARLEREVIEIKGARPVNFAQWVTRHGPVTPGDGGRPAALRWTASEPGTFQFAFLDLNRAKDWTEFRAALKRFPGPGQNFVYADVDGNIGYQATGLLPIRVGYGGDVPVDGSGGEFEWAGFIPFEELPSVYNPPHGLIVTANQNPFPADYKYAVHGDFAPEYRGNQIRAMLTGRNGLKPEDMLAVQKDVYSAFSLFLARRMIAAFDRVKPANQPLADAVSTLRGWNGQVEKSSPAPMLVDLAFRQFRKQLAESASPGKGDQYAAQMSPSVIQTLIENGGKGWFPDLDAVLVKSLKDGYEEGARIAGSNARRWDYGTYNEVTIRQPVVGQIPLVGAYFNIGPVPMSGSSTTVKQTTKRLGPSMRFVADLSDLDRSLNNLTVGESGQPFSWHYKDQWDAYYSARSLPMQFKKVEAKSTLTVNPK